MFQRFPMYAYIPVKDVARARKFYEQKLGFRPKDEVAGGVVYEFGERTGIQARRHRDARREASAPGAMRSRSRSTSRPSSGGC